MENGGDLDRLNTEGKSPIELCTKPEVKSFILSKV
jgi:hypothetical protein